MLNLLIRWSLDNRALVLTITAAFLAWGGYAITQLPVDVLPDFTAPTVTVIVEHPGTAPTDMERLVTYPIETALSGGAAVRRIRSATAVGVTIIWVEFDWGEDIYRARQTVTERLGAAARSLPPGTGQPVLGPVSSIMGEILFVAVTSDLHDAVELRTIADTIVRRRLLAVPGVAQVTPIGGGQKQYQVLLSPRRLKAYQVSLTEVERALSAASTNTSAGFRTQGGQEYLIQGLGRFGTLDEIRETVVRVSGAIPIQIKDLGAVQVGQALKRGAGSVNGTSAVVIGIRKQPGVNTLDLTSELDATIGALASELPTGMQVHTGLFRQADFIETAIANLEEALGYGGLLVVAVVVLFLANARASVITLFAIPFSLVAAFLGLKILGLSINGMTLGGLAIAIGELVDDAVIDVENIVRRWRQNAELPPDQRLSGLQVVFRASSEIRRSVVFATLIVMLLFLPLFALESVQGLLLRPLGIAYVTALFASLVVALTVTPALCSYLLTRSKLVIKPHDPFLTRILKAVYRPILRWSLDHSAVVMVAASIALLAALASFAWMGRAFLPAFNEGSLTISAVTVPGTSLDESDRLGTALEEILLAVPEVSSTTRRTGRAELDEHLQGVESAEIDVGLQALDRPKERMLAEIRDRASLIPGTNISIGQPISHRIDHMLSGTRSNVAIKIFGDDLRTLRELAAQVEQAIQGVPGVVDLASEQQTDIPTVTVRFRRDALARYGMQAGAAARALQTVFLGLKVGTVLEGEIAFPLVMRYQNGRPEQLETILETMIDTPAGPRVPLSAIAEIREDRSPNIVTRENGQRKIVVSCNVTGGDLRGVVSEIQRRISRDVVLPGRYRIEYGGQFESEAQTTRQILLIGALVLAGILALLATAFRSGTDAIIILCNLPLALIGGVVGVFLAGGTVTVASLIGFITLFGVATRNGIMLISHIKHLMSAEGVTDFRMAVTRGASERLAPILMTALSTGIALLPVGLGLGETGSEIHAPLALVVICGLMSSTVLNMIVVPAAYWRFGRAVA